MRENNENLGVYIAFEGQEGCGKSTQAAALAADLGAVLTREPGGTALGRSIRQEVLHGQSTVDPRAEALLFAADRAQHVSEVILPALAQGRHVVSDRSVWSSVAYQGIARGLGSEEIVKINEWATNGVFPEIVILLDASYDDLRARMKERQLDRIEHEGPEFFNAVRAGFVHLSKVHNWIVVDATASVDEIREQIREAVEARTRRTGGAS